MKRFVLALFCALALAIANTTVTYNNDGINPYVLSFGLNTIIAARLNASGHLEVAKFKTSLAYQHFYYTYLNDLDKPMSNLTRSQADYQSTTHAERVHVFRQEFSTVFNGLTKLLSYTPEFASLSLPSHFAWPVRKAALEALSPDETEQYGHFYSWQNIKIACEAFKFHQCKDISRQSKECHDRGPVTMIFVLEYEDGYIHAALLEMGWDWEEFIIMEEKTCVGCGEKMRQAGKDEYNHQVRNFLNGFIDKYFSFTGVERDDVRAIVLTGEASADAFSELGQIALDAVGTDVVAIAPGIDPADVLAYGAAAFARKTPKYKGRQQFGLSWLMFEEELYEKLKRREMEDNDFWYHAGLWHHGI